MLPASTVAHLASQLEGLDKIVRVLNGVLQDIVTRTSAQLPLPPAKLVQEKISVGSLLSAIQILSVNSSGQ